jgi:hypothetical protein
MHWHYAIKTPIMSVIQGIIIGPLSLVSTSLFFTCGGGGDAASFAAVFRSLYKYNDCFHLASYTTCGGG